MQAQRSSLPVFSIMSLDFSSPIKEINSDSSPINSFQYHPGSVYIQHRKKGRTQSTHSRTLHNKHQATLTNNNPEIRLLFNKQVWQSPTLLMFLKIMIKVVITHLLFKQEILQTKVKLPTLFCNSKFYQAKVDTLT